MMYLFLNGNKIVANFLLPGIKNVMQIKCRMKIKTNIGDKN